MTQLFNKASEKQKRRKLRRTMPHAERLLWSRLRRRQIEGYKFRRQVSIGHYIVDFYCPALRLVIEVDGDSHFQAGAPSYDMHRQTFLEQLGLHVLRFTNRDVYRNLNGVVETIRRMIEELDSQREGVDPPVVPPS